MSNHVVDLFSGCGGMSLGFQGAGFEIVGAFEHWDKAAACHAANFSHPVFTDDLSDVEGAVRKIRDLSPDVITGGPPCQDFSLAGKQTEGARAALTVSFAEIIATIAPRCFVMENVPKAQKSEAYAVARKIFKGAGYGLTEVVLNAALCGVPQRRKRFFCIGSLGDDDNFLSAYTANALSKTEMTVREYFGDSLDFDFYFKKPTHKSKGNRLSRYTFSVDEPSATITTRNEGIPGYYAGQANDACPFTRDIHQITMLERAKIQTFPDDFDWSSGVGKKGGTGDANVMIGNAVPVKLAEFVARALAHHMDLNVSHTAEVKLGDVTYEVGIDEDGVEYARTYNAKNKMWVRLAFSQTENNEAVQSVLDALKSDYIQRISACE